MPKELLFECCRKARTSCWKNCCNGSTRSQERRKVMEQAEYLAENADLKVRRYFIIINPVGGGGHAVEIYNKYVSPILNIGGIITNVHITTHQHHATEMVKGVGDDLDNLPDGFMIVGGDGLVSEAITGTLSFPEGHPIRDIPIVIAPGGTGNAFSNLLYPGGDRSRENLACRAALAVLQHNVRSVDVLQITYPDENPHFALSLIGWGLAGTVTDRAERLRWMPWNRSYRYDLAGFISLIRDWPTVGRAKARWKVSHNKHLDERMATYKKSYVHKKVGFFQSKGTEIDEPHPEESDFSQGEEVWEERDVNAVNMMAVNVPSLGLDHPVCRDLRMNDGLMSINIISEGIDRPRLVKLLMGMKHGKYLQEQPGVESFKVTEFWLDMKDDKQPPFNVDGDPHVATKTLHVQVLKRAVKVIVGAKAPLVRNTNSVRRASHGIKRLMSRKSVPNVRRPTHTEFFVDKSVLENLEEDDDDDDVYEEEDEVAEAVEKITHLDDLDDEEESKRKPKVGLAPKQLSESDVFARSPTTVGGNKSKIRFDPNDEIVPADGSSRPPRSPRGYRTGAGKPRTNAARAKIHRANLARVAAGITVTTTSPTKDRIHMTTV